MIDICLFCGKDLGRCLNSRLNYTIEDKSRILFFSCLIDKNNHWAFRLRNSVPSYTFYQAKSSLISNLMKVIL